MSPLQITDEAIAGYVSARCHELCLGPQAVKGPCRSRELVRARAILATELRRAPSIGRALGGRDHSTILWALRGGRHGRKLEGL